MMKKYTVFWFLLVLMLPAVLGAQEVFVRDTTVQRGTIFPVNVYVNGIPEGKVMSLQVRYKRELLQFIRVEGGDERLMQCAPPQATPTTDPLSTKLSGVLYVTCSNVRAASSGVLFTLYFEALAGPDSTSLVRPDSLIVDGVKIEREGMYMQGTVSIPGVPVFPQPSESLSQNYPNPFAINTTFTYIVRDPADTNASAEPEFSIFSLTGRHVASADYTIVPSPTKVPAVPGFSMYSIILVPGFNMANGAYLMQMTTENGVYRVPFFFIR